MSAYRIVWEDESKAREVEIFVDYSLSEGAVQVNAIRPTRVSFFDPQTGHALRSIGIHTPTGRRMLTEQYLAARTEPMSLEDEIRQQIDLLDEERTMPVSG